MRLNAKIKGKEGINHCHFITYLLKTHLSKEDDELNGFLPYIAKTGEHGQKPKYLSKEVCASQFISGKLYIVLHGTSPEYVIGRTE